ncbi:MAG: alpha/beta fold hydrolase, partial [Micromonosporaceae bacterium]
RLLGVDTVSRDHNFFDLGGNSLQATQLITRIRDRLGVTLDPRQTLTYPVLEQLAARVDETRRGVAVVRSTSPVVPIHSGGTRPPLFFVHPVGGSVAPYVRLASLLGADQPFYGIEDPGLHGAAPATGLADTAARYAAAVRTVSPEGPYHLGGWSLGGAIALAMAHELGAATTGTARGPSAGTGGAADTIVVALDTGLPAEPYRADRGEVLSWFVRDLAGIVGAPVPPVDLEALRRLPDPEQVEAVLDVVASARLTPADVAGELRTRIAVFTANTTAFLDHRPEASRGPLVLLHAAGDPDADPGYVDRWRSLAGNGFSHHAVPGNHYTMLQPPHLPVLAGVLRRCLDRVPPHHTRGGTR